MYIYLLRHGETDSNLQKVIQGTIDTHLNATGHEQARCLGQRLASIKARRIFCSDLSRCKETLQHVLDQQQQSHENVEVVYTPELRERYMAELQGVSKQVVEDLCKQHNKAKWEFGETWPAILHRLESFWRVNVLPLYKEHDHDETDLHDTSVNGDSGISRGDGSTRVRETAREDGSVFICSHGASLLTLNHALVATFGFDCAEGINIKQPLPNTAVTVLNTTTKRIEMHADISHLAQLGTAEEKREAKMEVVDV